MKRFINILLILFVGGSSFDIFAQECKRFEPKAETEVQDLKSIDAKSYEGWKKFEIPNKISFYAPSALEKVEIKGGGSHPPSAGIYFESEDFQLGGDFTTSAYAPNIADKMLPTYCQWFSWIDGAFAFFWHFKPNTNRKKYESGIYFQFTEDKNYRLSIYLQSKEKDTKEIAEKIFKSVTFLNKPVKNRNQKTNKDYARSS